MPSAPPFIPFAAPDIGLEEETLVLETLRSGWLSSGEKVKHLESAFADFLGISSSKVLAVNSATAGLHLALEALGVGPGDEVITTTHTFTATAEVIRYVGARPVLVDVEQSTLCIDPAQVAQHITPRTRALIVVHFAGRSADMTALLSLARAHGIMVVEDAAHALPATHRRHMIGTLDSDATVFSFYANKTMTTGEGGMLILQNPASAERMRAARLHGIDRDAFTRSAAQGPSWRYDIVTAGFKYNMTDIAAALGLAQLAKLERMHARRQAIALYYLQELEGLSITLPPPVEPGETHAWHLFPIEIHGMERDRFIESMFAQGVGTGVHYIPLHQMSYWKELCAPDDRAFPVSDATSDRIVSLPLYSRMDDRSVARVVEAVRRSCATARRP